MDEYRIARMVLIAEVCGGQVRGRPRLDWMDGLGQTILGRLPKAQDGLGQQRDDGGGCVTINER